MTGERARIASCGCFAVAARVNGKLGNERDYAVFGGGIFIYRRGLVQGQQNLRSQRLNIHFFPENENRRIFFFFLDLAKKSIKEQKFAVIRPISTLASKSNVERLTMGA